MEESRKPAPVRPVRSVRRRPPVVSWSGIASRRVEVMAAENGADPRTVKTPDLCGGEGCVRDTRLTVSGLEEWRRLGWSDERILVEYPQLTPEDLAAAWAYVEQHPGEIEQAIRENQEA